MNAHIHEIIEKANHDDEVIAVALFGSFARNERYRDIDVCIFLKPQSYKPIDLSRKKLSYTQENQNIDVQIFQQLPLYIRKRILEEMKIEYCRDEDALYDLCFTTLREFGDFKYCYEDYLKGVESG